MNSFLVFVINPISSKIRGKFSILLKKSYVLEISIIVSLFGIIAKNFRLVPLRTSSYPNKSPFLNFVII